MRSISRKAETTAITKGAFQLRPPWRTTGGMYQSGNADPSWARWMPMGTASSAMGASGSAARARAVSSASVRDLTGSPLSFAIEAKLPARTRAWHHRDFTEVTEMADDDVQPLVSEAQVAIGGAGGNPK